jgi:hypothetical protein
MITQEVRDKDFQKIPHVLIDAGVWAKLNRKQAKVYVALNRFADYKTGIAKPTVKTLVKLSGVHKNEIASTTLKLSMMGLIESYGTSRRFNYRIIYKVYKAADIDLDRVFRTIPQKTDKCRKKVARGKDGKFIGSPRVVDLGFPQSTEIPSPQDLEARTIPQKVDKKENLETNNRDNNKRDIPEQK